MIWFFFPIFFKKCTGTVTVSPYRVWLNTQICVLRITPIYRLGNIGYDAYHSSQQTDLKNLFYFQYLTVLKIVVFSVNNPARIFFIQLGTLITPTYRFIEIMKVRKMERAENSDLDTSLAPGKYGNIFQEQEFRTKVPSEYANLRIQLGKDSWKG